MVVVICEELLFCASATEVTNFFAILKRKKQFKTKNVQFTGFPRVMEFLEYHGILKGLLQILKFREFYIFFAQVMEYQLFLFVNSIQYSYVVFCVNSVHRQPQALN